MNHLVIGYGQIGQAIGAILGAHRHVDVGDSLTTPDAVDVMHVCFPYSDDFLDDVADYTNEYAPSHIVIYSTLPIGTTKQIPKAVHSPVEGKHPDLEDSIRLMERWIGYNDKAEGLFFSNLFHSLGLNTKLVQGSDATEALKLLSTTEYGLNIEFARYKKMIADSIGMDYELCKEFNMAYNRLYKDLGMEKRYQKYVLDAPEGPKGGHCVVPNAQILQEQYPNDMVKLVGEL